MRVLAGQCHGRLTAWGAHCRLVYRHKQPFRMGGVACCRALAARRLPYGSGAVEDADLRPPGLQARTLRAVEVAAIQGPQHADHLDWRRSLKNRANETSGVGNHVAPGRRSTAVGARC